MNEHPEYEFVIDEPEESICGISVADVFQKLPETFIGKEGDFADRILECLARNGIQDNIGKIKETVEFLERFFNALQKKLVGTWKWYDNSLGRCWLLDFRTNTPKKNGRIWRWKGKTLTPEHKAKIIEANKHKHRRPLTGRNKIKRKNFFNDYISSLTPEERKAFYLKRALTRKETMRRKKAEKQNDNTAK